MDDAPNFEVKTPGGSLVGWRTGVGPPVVVLHGGPGLSDTTEALAAELTDSYTVYRYQQRGLEPSTTEGPFDIETHVADACALLDVIGEPDAFVVGHSWGGHLAMHLAAAHPGRVRGLVVVDPLGAVGDGGEADLERILGARVAPEAAARAAELDAHAMAGDGTAEEAVEGLALVWPGYFASPADASPMPPISISLACYSETWDSVHDHLERRTLQRVLPQVTAPTVFVLGAESPIPPEHGMASAALVPGATVETLEDCGHFLWLERPGAVRAALDAVRHASSQRRPPK